MLKLQPKSLFVGQNQIYLPHCHSTNDVASELGREDGFPDGTVVITDYQTGGRGQRGTAWEGESGKNLMMSLLLDTSFLTLSHQFDLSICASLGAVTALKDVGLSRACIKWPNDLHAESRKVGGILIENTLRDSSLRFSVVGMGINILQTTFQNPNATSLEREGCLTAPHALAEKICEHFEKFYLEWKAGKNLRETYLASLFGLNVERSFVSDNKSFRGIIRGVSPAGELLVESDFPKKIFDIKEISFCF